MLRRCLAAVLCLVCVSVVHADDGYKPVNKQPFLSILVPAKDNTWEVHRGRYIGKGETLAEPPVEDLFCAQIEVQTGLDAKIYVGWCFGDEKNPLDVTKRKYLTVFIPKAKDDEFRFARGIYLGVAEHIATEPRSEDMVAVTVLVRTVDSDGKRSDKLETGWVYKTSK